MTDLQIINQMAYSYLMVSYLYNRMAWDIVAGWYGCGWYW